MIDYAHKEKADLLAGKIDWRAVKVQAAIETMGRQYVLHPCNRVKKLAAPLPEVFQWKAPRVLKRGRK